MMKYYVNNTTGATCYNYTKPFYVAYWDEIPHWEYEIRQVLLFDYDIEEPGNIFDILEKYDLTILIDEDEEDEEEEEEEYEEEEDEEEEDEEEEESLAIWYTVEEMIPYDKYDDERGAWDLYGDDF